MTTLAKNAKSRARDLLAQIATRKNDIARAFYDIGRVLGELHEKKLFGSLGYASFDEMLEAEKLMTGQYARRLIQVARAFDREQAQRLGAEKAYALVRYVARTKEADDPAEYLLEGFPVPGGRRRSIDDVDAREIVAATRMVVLRQKGQHSASERARRDAAKAARAVAAKLRGRTDAQAEVHHVFRRGSWWLEVLVPAEMSASIR
ncbi:MAG TPA: hypothetical protein VH054_04030 [Polyangiaceae bacterium]|jgi:hypothetical protein|nr:hypothetical protein [Polyangiaceae bacterium]